MRDGQPCHFQALRDQFRNVAQEISANSIEYQAISDRLEELLLLGDRVLLACSEHPQFERTMRVAEILDRMARGGDRALEEEDLLADSEPWLKTILWLVFVERWNLHNQSKGFNLYAVLRELKLLTHDELEEKERPGDYVREILLRCREGRNHLHRTERRGFSREAELLLLAFVVLIAPLYKHYDAILQGLTGLITAPLDVGELEVVLKTVNSERRGHLESFAGRDNWICTIRRYLENELRRAGGYLLLRGKEGCGKSAVCAKLTEALCAGLPLLGAHASSARRVAPWLPASLVHFGKQSNQPGEIVRLLVGQANSLLLNPVEPKWASEEMAVGSLTELDSDQWSKGRSVVPRAADYAANSGYLTRAQDHLPQSVSQDPTQLRRLLYAALERVAQERGTAVLVIDALDEVSSDGSGLAFLPERLPPGVTALLTVRTGTAADLWIRANRVTEKLSLDLLRRDEIPLLTGVADESSPSAKAFNDRVWNVSGGLALLVRAAADSLRENGGNFDLVKVDGSMERWLVRKADCWQDCIGAGHPGLLHEVLVLLAIFEPVTPLELQSIQAFLACCGMKLSMTQLRRELKPVESQIDGLESGRVKLGTKALAEYVRSTKAGYCSPLELREALQSGVDWLAQDEDVDAEVIGRFLRHWTDRNQVSDDRFRSISASLITKLSEGGKARPLRRAAAYLWFSDGRESPVAEDCLRLAAQLGDERAMAAYGSRLLDGRGMRRNPGEGARWLRGAAEQGNATAMGTLGSRLVDGKGLPADPVEGREWLEKAATGGELRAATELGNRLIEGDGLQQDVAEGEEWLRSAAADGETTAMGILATRLITGTGLSQDLLEGEQLLRSAADTGDTNAMGLLASFLIDGEYLEADPQEGQSLLERADDKGDMRATRELADRLLEGRGLPKDVSKGRGLLLRAAERGDRSSMLKLGQCLVDGEGFEPNPEEGTSWIRKAAEAGYPPAMVDLAALLLEQPNPQKERAEARQLLTMASELGYPRAMYALAVRLLDGDGFAKDPVKGEHWLRRASDEGLSRATRLLAERLLDGKGMKRSPEEGERLLRQAADSEDVEARLILARRLLDGEGLTKDVSEGERLLREAARQGSTEAKTLLATRLIEGGSLSANPEEGGRLLLEAANEGDLEAMRLLGLFRINDKLPPVDLVEGERWLRKAADAGHTWAIFDLINQLCFGKIRCTDPKEPGRLNLSIMHWVRARALKNSTDAMVHLGNTLLEGIGVPKNPVEGKKWLSKAAELGDALAMINLGNRFMEGDGVSPSPSKGEYWLKKAAEAGRVDGLAILGQHKYAEGDCEAAARLFVAAMLGGDSDAGNNVAYLVRRGEMPDGFDVPGVEELLEPLVAKGHSFAVMNKALCLALGVHWRVNWREADSLVVRITEPSRVLEWWHKTASDGDPEGHLVIGWIHRHGLVEDPEGKSTAERMERARAGGFNVPAWLDLPSSAGETA